MNSTNVGAIPTMLTINEAAREANMSYNSVRQLCLQGKVKTIKVGEGGNKWLINRESFYRFLTGET